MILDINGQSYIHSRSTTSVTCRTKRDNRGEALSQPSYTLAHRVWNYDTNGNFLGTIHLSESVKIHADGSSQSGTFALDFYDPSGNFEFEVSGNVTGERIPVD